MESLFSERSFIFLRELLAAPSPTGFEKAGQQVWAEHVRPIADRIENDAYGTVWATRDGTRGDEVQVMLEAHADEIGFMINHVSSSGLLYVTRVGGSDPAIARAKRAVFQGDKGPVLAVFGNTAIHLRDSKEDKIPSWHELFLDIGADSEEEVKDRGLRVGHVGVYESELVNLTENRIMCRALDNRIGGFIIAEALRQVSEGEKTTAAVHAVNAVQEEIGGHGAAMVSYRLRPSVALVVDVTHATDTPGLEAKKHGHVVLGGGPSIQHGTANHPNVVKRLMHLAEEHGITLQHEASSRFTGTDTDSIFRSRRGIPSALISVPMRYMHSPAEIVDIRDVEKVVQLMAAFVKSVTSADEFAQEYV